MSCMQYLDNRISARLSSSKARSKRPFSTPRTPKAVQVTTSCLQSLLTSSDGPGASRMIYHARFAFAFSSCFDTAVFYESKGSSHEF